MFCSKCGNNLPDGTKFCSKCGNPVGGDVSNPAPAQPPIYTPPVTEPIAPVVEAPVVEAPVVEAPVVEAPVVEQPAYAAPVVETPVYAAPVAPQPTYTQPVQQPYYAQAQAPQYAPAKPDPNIPRYTIGMKQYLKQYALPNVKNTGTFKLIMSFVCIAVLVFNFFFSYFGCSLYTWVPSTTVANYFFEKANHDERIDELEAEFYDEEYGIYEYYDSFDEFLDENGIDKEYDSYFDHIEDTKDWEEEGEDYADEMKDELSDYSGDEKKLLKAKINYAETRSIHSYLTYINEHEDVYDEDYGDEDEFDLSDFVKIAAYVSIAMAVVYGSLAICGLLMDKKGLTKSGFVFATIYAVLFGGILQTILLVAAFVGYFLIEKSVAKHYKNFQMGIE